MTSAGPPAGSFPLTGHRGPSGYLERGRQPASDPGRRADERPKGVAFCAPGLGLDLPGPGWLSSFSRSWGVSPKSVHHAAEQDPPYFEQLNGLNHCRISTVIQKLRL